MPGDDNAWGPLACCWGNQMTELYISFEGHTLADIVGADIGVAKREATAMDTNTTDLCLLCRS